MHWPTTSVTSCAPWRFRRWWAQWSMTTRRERLVKIGAEIVRHGRSITFQMAEVLVPRALFQTMLGAIAAQGNRVKVSLGQFIAPKRLAGFHPTPGCLRYDSFSPFVSYQSPSPDCPVSLRSAHCRRSDAVRKSRHAWRDRPSAGDVCPDGGIWIGISADAGAINRVRGSGGLSNDPTVAECQERRLTRRREGRTRRPSGKCRFESAIYLTTSGAGGAGGRGGPPPRARFGAYQVWTTVRVVRFTTTG